MADATDIPPEDGELLDGSSDIDDVGLPIGNSIEEDEVASIRWPRTPRFVLVGGDVKAGKTTLIASLYQLFMKGPVGQYRFSGSKTIKGLEERLFLSQTKSGEKDEDTERTTDSAEMRFLHLCASSGGNQKVDLLFGDISGEAYRRARDSFDNCRRLKFLPRADYFTILVDTAKLVALGTRQSTKAAPLMLLQNCINSGSLRSHTKVKIAFSKWDKAATEDLELQELVKGISQDVMKMESSVAGISICKLAASTASDNFSDSVVTCSADSWVCPLLEPAHAWSCP